MMLFDAAGPNPRVVRMYLLEKGLDIPAKVLVIGTGENLGAAHLARNPLGQIPVLETDDGGFVSETLAICEYIEELHPEPCLIGRTPGERAETRMWARRADLNICEPIAHAFRFSPPGWRKFGARDSLAPEAAATMRTLARTGLAWLDGQMESRAYLCGERFTLADILLYVFVQYGIEAGQLLDPRWQALGAWFARIAARPAAAASARSRVEAMALSGTV